jgi:putative oxidoreductase
LEVISRIFLLVGVVTRISAALSIIDMIGAIVLVRLPDGFVDGYELESLLIAISVSLLITGRISVEWDILKREIFPKGKAIIQKQREATQKI